GYPARGAPGALAQRSRCSRGLLSLHDSHVVDAVAFLVDVGSRNEGHGELTMQARTGLVVASVLAALSCLTALVVYLGFSRGHGAAADGGWLPRTAYPVPKDALFVSPRGDDSAFGSKDAPLRTLKAAVRAAKAGQTIVLRAGTYREKVGLIGKRLTIQPYPNERVWFKG